MEKPQSLNKKYYAAILPLLHPAWSQNSLVHCSWALSFFVRKKKQSELQVLQIHSSCFAFQGSTNIWTSQWILHSANDFLQNNFLMNTTLIFSWFPIRSRRMLSNAGTFSGYVFWSVWNHKLLCSELVLHIVGLRQSNSYCSTFNLYQQEGQFSLSRAGT